MPRIRYAFTLIELLVVISIIAVLAGMILAAMNYVRENAKVNKTKAIMHGAMLGVSTTAMRTNVNISPVEHPLANSLAAATTPRSVFVRGETIAGAFAAGDTVAATGEALRASDAKTVDPSAITRLLYPTDRYCGTTAPSDCDAPALFGMERRYLTVLGTGYGLHTVRRLPAPSPQNDRNGDGVLDNPPYVDNPGSGVAYPNTLDSAPGDLTDQKHFEIEQKKLFDYILGPEVLSELTSLQGLRSADDASNPTLICNNRLRAGVKTYTTWQGNTVRVGDFPIVRDIDGTWKTYRLRGPALYDAWGHEILCYLASNGSLVFESAGRDGCFRWTPGADGVFQMQASDDAPSGDDSDAGRDNIATGLR